MSAHLTIPARLRDLRRREEGQGLTEYALILALASVVCASSLATLGGSFEPGFRKAADTLRVASVAR